MLYDLYQTAKSITDRTDDTKPMVDRRIMAIPMTNSATWLMEKALVLHMCAPSLAKSFIAGALKRTGAASVRDVVTENIGFQ